MRTGAAFVPYHQIARAAQVFSGASIAPGYGLSEGICLAHNGPGADVETALRTQGPPPSCQQIEVRDEQGKAVEAGVEGELFVRGASVFAGYLNDPEATRAVLDEKTG